MVVIGNPENRRVMQFQQALRDLQQAPAQVISYESILADQGAWQDALQNADYLRLESPGENFQVEQRILQLGGLEDAMALKEDQGRIYYPGAWYKGFQRLLKCLASAAGKAIWFNHPDDIATMFDKPLTKKLNSRHCLPLCPAFNSYEEFLSYIQTQRYTRFFIKLNYSSSASGVMAYEYHRKTGTAQAQTTIALVRNGAECRFYNSLKLKKYSRAEDLRDIINFLFTEGAYIEPWIPKARHEYGVFDLRVLAINGLRRHSIARLSRTPITNLHLGNQRVAVAELNLSAQRWQQIDQLITEVMANFSRSLYAGLDIVIPRSPDKAPILLEANAFGDLLPGLLHHGQNTYQAELTALYR